MLPTHSSNARHTPFPFDSPSNFAALAPIHLPKLIDFFAHLPLVGFQRQQKMAAVAGGATCSLVASIGAVASPQAVRRTSAKAGTRKLNLFGGLKAENKVMALGLTQSTEQKFASLATSCSARARTTCNVGQEILTIVPIMSGLVLTGIAIGFVLLRVEAAVEESE